MFCFCFLYLPELTWDQDKLEHEQQNCDTSPSFSPEAWEGTLCESGVLKKTLKTFYFFRSLPCSKASLWNSCSYECGEELGTWVPDIGEPHIISSLFLLCPEGRSHPQGNVQQCRRLNSERNSDFLERSRTDTTWEPESVGELLQRSEVGKGTP